MTAPTLKQFLADRFVASMHSFPKAEVQLFFSHKGKGTWDAAAMPHIHAAMQEWTKLYKTKFASKPRWRH